jgi:hypothetical protein
VSHNRLVRASFAVFASVLLSACGGDATFVMKSAIKASRLTNLADSLGYPRSLTGGTPTSFTAKFYAAYLTTSAACTAPFVEIADYRTAGQSFDIVASPTVFEASPAAGTYNCLIMELSDVFTFRPDATAQAANAACSTSSDKSFDIHRATETDWKTKDGQAIVGAGTVPAPAESTSPVSGVTIFVSTDPTQVSGPSTNQTLTLGAPLTVTDTTTTLTMYNDITGKISVNTDNSTDYCWMEPGLITLE